MTKLWLVLVRINEEARSQVVPLLSVEYQTVLWRDLLGQAKNVVLVR